MTDITDLLDLSTAQIEHAAGLWPIFADDDLGDQAAAMTVSDTASHVSAALNAAALVLGRVRAAGLHEEDTQAERVDYELIRSIHVHLSAALGKKQNEE